MDLVLEVFDTFVFDKVYASVLPLHNPELVAARAAEYTANAAVHAAEKAALAIGRNATSLAAASKRYGVAPTELFEPTLASFASVVPRSNAFRQAFSLFCITTVFGWVLYFTTAYLSYRFVYDHANFKHPKMLKNQMSMEIKQATESIPFMTMLTVPWFVLETQGYSKLYWAPEKHGWWYIAFQFPLFLLFTDCLIYMIHRGLHHPKVYKTLHKPHHKWIVPTPFASHAFHPVDGYLQSLPYHLFPFIFPLQKVAYVALFMIVNVWTVMIHDGDYLANDPVINGAACHTIHHLYFNYNYGQYTTLWDRIGGSYRLPDQELFNKSQMTSEKYLKKQVEQMENIQQSVEGKDDRVYTSGSAL